MFKIIDGFLTSRISGLALLVLVAALGAGALWLHHKGYTACIQDQQNKTITVMEERANIANNRPDDKQTIKRLKEGSF